MTTRARPLARRELLACIGGIALAACGGDDARIASPAVPGGGSGAGGSGCGNDCTGGTGGTGSDGGAGGGGPLTCTPSDANIEGPYYRADAPFATDLTAPELNGTRITIRGRVLSPSCEPVPGALLDFWQANDAGRYDNDGVDDPPDGAFVLRGRQQADTEGRFAVRTILPGRYLNGAQYRPAHVHVKVSAPGFAPLTTQLYFEGDPYNDVDPFIVDSLIMTLEDVNGEPTATFDFVIAPA